MSLKAELETWAAALKAYDAQEFEKSIDLFREIDLERTVKNRSRYLVSDKLTSGNHSSRPLGRVFPVVTWRIS